jgi:hypothetical protein
VVGRVIVSVELDVAVSVTALVAGSVLTARTEPVVVAVIAAATARRVIQRCLLALPFELRECERAAPLVRSSFLIVASVVVAPTRPAARWSGIPVSGLG